jgi:hypothetical protein
MSFFPETFNPRDDVSAILDLVEIETPDGPARFMIGVDGIFTDINGNEWAGSQLVSVESLKSAIDGIAPAGSATLSYFQDPSASNLIEQINALGVDYIRGSEIRFLVQPITSMGEFYAPATPPLQWLSRVVRAKTVAMSGGLDRSITLSFEAWSEYRRAARRIVLNTEGHARLTGSANPSLEFMPTTNFTEEKLFG